MGKNDLKGALATMGYRIGLPQTMIKLGDLCSFKRRRHFYLPEWRPQRSFQILIYHRVNENLKNISIDTVSSESFKKQMEFLTRYFNVSSLNEILDCIESGKKIPKRCIVITFDDGYEDNYLFAFPILKKLGLPATIFLTAGCIDKRENLWFNRILYAFEQTSEDHYDMTGKGSVVPLISRVQKFKAAFDVLYRLIDLPNEERLSEIDVVCDRLGMKNKQDRNNQMLKWSQVREMAEDGISFGSHTLTHPILSKISLEEAEKEVNDSRELIESRTGLSIRIFAYPVGRKSDYSDEIIDIIRKAGYRAALTTNFGVNNCRGDVYQLKRITSRKHDFFSFAWSLGYHNLVKDS